MPGPTSTNVITVTAEPATDTADEPPLLTEPVPAPVVYLDENGRVEMFVPEVGQP